MHTWPELYAKDLVRPMIEGPNEITVRGLSYIKERGKILDVGAGFGYDSLYICQQGFDVDAVDLANTCFPIRNATHRELRFFQGDIFHFRLPAQYYQGVIMNQVLQFIEPDSVEEVVLKAVNSIRSRGILVLNYVYESTKFDESDSLVQAYAHRPDQILDLIESSHLSMIEPPLEIAHNIHPVLNTAEYWTLEFIAQKR